MTSTSISPHDLLHPFPAHTTIHQLVTPTDHHGRHYCHDWVSHHHHQQAGSDDGLKHEMDIQNGIGAWVWEEQKDDTDDFDSDDINESWVPSVVKKMNPKRASTASSVPVVGNTDDSPPENDSSSSNNNGIRVCSDCNTTKTPLWRSGPRGPKSLCNACGIRQRKARRALAAASAAIENNAATSSPKSLKVNNSKEMKKSSTKQGGRQGYKKMLKISATNPEKDADDEGGGGRKEICFEEFITINLSKNTALHPVFPQDEKEAAILLMALSCGLVHN